MMNIHPANAEKTTFSSTDSEQHSASSQLPAKLKEIDNSNEPLEKPTKKQSLSSQDLAGKVPDAELKNLLASRKKELEERRDLLNEKNAATADVINFSCQQRGIFPGKGEVVPGGEQMTLYGLTKDKCDELKEIEAELATIDLKLLQLQK
ncbi:hypothetical protein [Erwinia amylovora]|nr:hypothetical protein [Erwinia amylovora]MCK8166803.1 hypothetical protein [Erwinia amylovora]MCK8170286.1 hypothetical protein [Erwinia amylovora]MCK8180259.1 hypothetical protein [Erwinia amylovora]MCK8213789.1 hypothetical protein [Erwinia amylovora]MCK8223895.1 hypothetical protein [Erwinia amylovora]